MVIDSARHLDGIILPCSDGSSFSVEAEADWFRIAFEQPDAASFGPRFICFDFPRAVLTD